mgnify:CR=1 FL=1
MFLMAVADYLDNEIYGGLFDSSNYKKSKILSNLDRDIVLNVLSDYQYSDKSVERISKEYGLSKYMINKIIDIADETGSHDGRLVKRRIRDNLARELLKSNDIDWGGLSNGQIEYIAERSKQLRDIYTQEKEVYAQRRQRKPRRVFTELSDSELELRKSKRIEDWLDAKVLCDYQNTEVSVARISEANRISEEEVYSRLNRSGVIEKLKDGLEYAIALDNCYRFDEVLEFSGWSEDYLNRVVEKARQRFRNGDRELKFHLTKILSEDRLDRKKQVLEFAIANSENPEVYQEYLEEISRAELKEDKKGKYLPGFEPDVFSLNYWREGFWKRGIKEFFGDWFNYACVGVGLGAVVFGIYNLGDYAKRDNYPQRNSIFEERSIGKNNTIGVNTNRLEEVLKNTKIKFLGFN